MPTLLLDYHSCWITTLYIVYWTAYGNLYQKQESFYNESNNGVDNKGLLFSTSFEVWEYLFINAITLS